MALGRYVETYPAWAPGSLRQINRVERPTPFLDFLNVKFALTSPTIDPGAGWRLVEESEGFRIYENLRALPRIFVPASVRLGGSTSSRLDDLARRSDFLALSWLEPEDPVPGTERETAVLVIPAGTNAATLTVWPVDDGLVEEPESVNVAVLPQPLNIDPPVVYRPGEPSIANGVIRSDDLTPNPRPLVKMVSPADGVIQAITPRRPPAELGLGDAPRTCISVFLNIFDVHVNRAPIGGRITRLAYHPGKFLNAAHDKASEDNERQSLRIETAQGDVFGCVQIAGLIARRIVCAVREGEVVSAGQRVGLIRFGSRCDVYLPAGMAPQVLLGQRAIAGETVLADGRRNRAASGGRRS